MYIITNSYEGGEYTPSYANSYEEALAWMKECTAGNIRDANDQCENMSDDEVVEWANANSPAFEFDDVHSYIEYSWGSYQLMNIYNFGYIRGESGCRL